MKYKSLILLVIITISCQKDDILGYRGTYSNYLKFTFKDKEYSINGSITFTPIAKEELIESNYTLSRRCTNYSTDYSYTHDDSKDDIMLRMTIPALSNMINDTLIGKYYRIESGGGCGSDRIGGHIFGLDLDLELNNKWYPSRFEEDFDNYYNQVTNIRYLGNYYNDTSKSVYEIQGNFKIAVVDQDVNPNIIYNIEDGEYSVTIVTYNEDFKPED